MVFQNEKASSKKAGDQLFSILIVAWLNLPQGRRGLDTWKKIFLAVRADMQENRQNREALGQHSLEIFRNKVRQTSIREDLSILNPARE